MRISKKKKKGFAIDFVLFIFHPRSLRENENILKTILNMLIKDKGWHVTVNISLELSLGYIFTTLETKEGKKKKRNKESQHIFPNINSFQPRKGTQEREMSF